MFSTEQQRYLAAALRGEPPPPATPVPAPTLPEVPQGRVLVNAVRQWHEQAPAREAAAETAAALERATRPTHAWVDGLVHAVDNVPVVERRQRRTTVVADAAGQPADDNNNDTPPATNEGLQATADPPDKE